MVEMVPQPFLRRKRAIGWLLVAMVAVVGGAPTLHEFRQALTDRDQRMAERTGAATRQLWQGVSGIEVMAEMQSSLAGAAAEGASRQGRDTALEDEAVAASLRRSVAQPRRLGPSVLRVTYVSRSGFTAAFPSSGATAASMPPLGDEVSGVRWGALRRGAQGSLDASCTIAVRSHGRWLGNIVIDVAVGSLSPGLLPLSTGSAGEVLGGNPILAPLASGANAPPLPAVVERALLSEPAGTVWRGFVPGYAVAIGRVAGLPWAVISFDADSVRWWGACSAAFPWAVAVVTALALMIFTMHRIGRQQDAQALAEREAMEKAQDRLDFLGTMAHEIRGPLEGVMGIIRFIQGTDLTKEQRDMLDSVVTASQLQLALLDDMLDMVRLEHHTIDFKAEPFALAPWAGEIMRIFDGKARDKGLALRFEIDPAIPSVVLGDSARLRQVLINLVSNAVRFTENGGVTLSIGRGETGLRFLVSDSGIGITPDAQERIFEPFVQENSAVASRYGGHGLGLSICRRMMRAMGGSIGVESVPGVGSTFWVGVDLPAASLQPTPTARLNILMVEDNPFLGQIECLRLREAGHGVTLVDSGEGALQTVARETFDVVLMDLRLPGMDGIETVRRMRAEVGLPLPLLIVHSAGMASDMVERYAEAGFDGQLPKGFELVALLRLVARARGEVAVAEDAGEAKAESLIDGTRLDLVRSACGIEAVAGILQDFAGSSSSALATMEAFGRGESAEAALRAVDIFAAQSADLGFTGLVAVAGRIESMIYRNELQALNEAVHAAQDLRCKTLALAVQIISDCSD